MDIVQVIYPRLFGCYPKFARKVTRIVRRLDQFMLAYDQDPNGFVSRLCEEDGRSFSCQRIGDGPGADEISHAIVFDDGEEFPDVVRSLEQKGVPTRAVKIRLTRVVNINSQTEYAGLKSTPCYEYVGRGSYWGNPYSICDEGESREEVIRLFKYDFDNDIFPKKEKSRVFELTGKRLGCFCKPLACHADVLADFLNAWDDGK